MCASAQERRKMRTQSNQLPSARVVLDTIGGKTTATLWNGIYTEAKVSEDTERENQRTAEYEYILYQINVEMRPNLAEDIEAKFGDWYAAAAELEQRQKTKNEMEEIEREMAHNMLNTLLDYDFRLMMLEELY